MTDFVDSATDFSGAAFNHLNSKGDGSLLLPSKKVRKDLVKIGGKLKLRVMSTFSGISAASIAWDAADYDFAAYAEVAPFPCHVLHYRREASRPKYLPEGYKDSDYSTLPETGVPNWGDITQITDNDLESMGEVDVLEGGSPCQDFSVAGMRQGLDGQRGNLTLAFCLLAERMRKINNLKFVVWENVHGVLSDRTNGFGNLLAALVGERECALQPPGKKWSNAGHVSGPQAQVAWRTIEASLWGIPQRRKRVFALASFGETFSDIGNPTQVLFERDGVPWDIEEGNTAWRYALPTFRGHRGLEFDDSDARYHRLKLRALERRKIAAIAKGDIISLDLTSPTEKAWSDTYALADDYKPKASKNLAYTLMAGSPTGGGHKQNVVYRQNDEGTDSGNWVVRRLTPLECEGLQGFPDFWTDVPYKGKLSADGPRYKAIGNSMPVPVMAFIGYYLFMTYSMLYRIELKLQKDTDGAFLSLLRPHTPS